MIADVVLSVAARVVRWSARRIADAGVWAADRVAYAAARIMGA